MTAIDDSKYKPNSYKSKAEAEKEREPLSPVVQNNGSVHKETAEEKIITALRNIGSYFVHQVLVPSLIDMAREGLHSATDMLLPGGTRGRSRGRSRNTQYDQISERRRNATYDMSKPARRREFDFSTVDLYSLADAERVVQGVLDNIDIYNRVRVADFYSLAGVSSSSTDNNWGWERQDIPAIENAQIYSYRVDGETRFWIDMPRPRPLI